MCLTEICNRHPLAYALAAFVLSAAAFNAVPGDTFAGMVVQTFLAAACVILCLAAGRPRWLICWRNRAGELHGGGKRRQLRGWGAVSFYLLGIALAMGVLDVAASAFGGSSLSRISAVPVSAFTGYAAALFLFLCLLTGAFEEVLFRGILFGAMASSMQKAGRSRPLLAGALVSAAVFGLMHVSGSEPSLVPAPDQATLFLVVAQIVIKPLQAALFGFVMAFAVARSGSLLFAAGLHAGYNALSEGPDFLLTLAAPTTYLTGSPVDLAVLVASTALLVPLAVKAKRGIDVLDATAESSRTSPTCIL